MPLQYQPNYGEVLKCDFNGFIDPEMVKSRWVVVVSPLHIKRYRLATVVPLSTTPPNPIEKYHYKLTTVLPHNDGKDIEVWAKCDMIFSASYSRINAWWLDKTRQDKRVYIPVILNDEDISNIRECILISLGAGG